MNQQPRELSASDLGEIGWNEVGPGLYRIVADVTCAHCGAYQAADCDPTSRKDPAIRMTVQLLNSVGWRVVGSKTICPDCAAK